MGNYHTYDGWFMDSIKMSLAFSNSDDKPQMVYMSYPDFLDFVEEMERLAGYVCSEMTVNEPEWEE